MIFLDAFPWDTTTLYLAVGLTAGMLAGLFGIGGGILLVPFLLWSLPQQGVCADGLMLTALGTSFGVILPTSSASGIAHARRGNVCWRSVSGLAPGLLLGTSAGAHLASGLPAGYLVIAFAIFQTYVAARLVWQRPQASVAMDHPTGRGSLFLAGTVIGALSALFGIGGGTLTVPYLLRHQLNIRQAIGTSAICGIPIAFSGLMTYIWLGWQHEEPVPHMLGYLWWPGAVALALTGLLAAPWGARLATHLPMEKLRVYFALLLLGIATRLLLR